MGMARRPSRTAEQRGTAGEDKIEPIPRQTERFMQKEPGKKRGESRIGVDKQDGRGGRDHAQRPRK